MQPYPWRVWLAFEMAPGISTCSSRDRSEHYRNLYAACRGSNDKIDLVEFEHWLDVMVQYAHLWGEA